VCNAWRIVTADLLKRLRRETSISSLPIGTVGARRAVKNAARPGAVWHRFTLAFFGPPIAFKSPAVADSGVAGRGGGQGPGFGWPGLT